MDLYVEFKRTHQKAKKGRKAVKRMVWRWRMTARNGEVIGASTESYLQRPTMIKNFTLCTGFKPPTLERRPKGFKFRVSIDDLTNRADALVHDAEPIE